MALYLAAALFAGAVFPTSANTEELSIRQWIDVYVELCVGSGSSTIVSGLVKATDGAEIALQNIDAEQKLVGEVKITRSQSQLLTDGIDNKMSSVAAAEADKVRDCLEPVRAVALYAMAHPDRSNLFILAPDENRIMRALATAPGLYKETGKDVESGKLRVSAEVGEVRARYLLHHMQNIGLVFVFHAFSFPETVSMTDKGDEYAVIMQFVR